MVIRDDPHSRGLVLVVEVNQGMRQAIDTLLDVAGFSGISYGSTEDLLGGGRFGDALCVISDVKLPGASGFELLTRLRRAGASTPVILISANETAALRNKARSSGAAAYLTKPFPGIELLAVVERIAESARSSAAMRFSRRPTRK